MSYNSSHTGAQIDEAVEAVLTGLPPEKGGTGQTTLKDSMNALVDSATVLAQPGTLPDSTCVVCQTSNVDGIAIRVPVFKFFEYFKLKLNSVYAALSHNHSTDNITSGTLSAERGGTGNATLKDSMNALVNSLGTGTDTPTDNDYYVSQYAGGGDTTTTYHRRPVSSLWKYIKSKADSVYEPSITTLPVSKGGTGETARLESLSLSSVQGTGSYALRYYPYLKMCFLRMQVKGFTVEQGKTTTVGVVPSGYRPSYINALSVYYSGYGTIVKAQINSSGEIRILSSAALSTSANVYITGWWIVS